MIFYLLILFCVANANARHFYVSSSAKSSDGVCGSIYRPFNNLTWVLLNATNGDHIYLLRGDVFSGSFTSEKSNLTIGAYTDGTRASTLSPILTQSVPFDLSQYVEGRVFGKYKTLQYNLSFVMPNTGKTKAWAVWIDGLRYMPARYPNLINPSKLYGLDSNEFVPIDKIVDSNRIFVKDYALYKEKWINATLRVRDDNWGYIRTIVTGFDSSTNSFIIDKSVSKWASAFYVENIPEELDAPGEYWYDEKENLLYIIPCDSSSCVKDAASPYEKGGWILPFFPSTTEKNFPYIPRKTVNEDSCKYFLSYDANVAYCPFDSYTYALKITGNNTIVSDLYFTKSLSGLGVAGSQVTVEDCVFTKIMDSGIKSPMLSSSIISSVTMKDIGIYGIFSTATFMQINQVEIQNVGLVAGYSYQGAGISCANCLVQGNTVSKCGFAGYLPLENSVFISNSITDWGVTFANAGAFYTSGLYSHNITIDSNTIYGVDYANMCSSKTGLSEKGAAIFLDQGSSNITIVKNKIDSNTKTFSCIRIRNSQNIILKYNDCQVGGLLISNNPGFSGPETILTTYNNFTRTSGYLIAYDNITQSTGASLTEMIYDNGLILFDCSRIPSNTETFPGVDDYSAETLKTKNKFYCKRKKSQETSLVRSASKCFIKVPVTKTNNPVEYTTTVYSTAAAVQYKTVAQNTTAVQYQTTPKANPSTTAMYIQSTTTVNIVPTCIIVIPSSTPNTSSYNVAGKAKVVSSKAHSLSKLNLLMYLLSSLMMII